ncbi:hypothetical protein BN7_5841 [Wickerhamomyces ciferrii]|uniref:Uncharacterized protein n=1 Tax=Wickerhamomyces ciferrii (strain ATCC 14091 / BCRC 22168 / CBS 111 / JCM 3599 / NBRC 0793 / NRRL Y-1031 F-60-10) TaxID=1206466 RepID=K0KLW2_WICCF|nr:uncharacterized protein BN7_5841 [Wickerhamomyces ciferrii]CCH46250.1 hypothetical protein BN7_5841 [Wickerhamomyces ciferrii]
MDAFNNIEAFYKIVDGLRPSLELDLKAIVEQLGLKETVIYPSQVMLDSIHRALCTKFFKLLDTSFFIQHLNSSCLNHAHSVVESIIKFKFEQLQFQDTPDLIIANSPDGLMNESSKEECSDFPKETKTVSNMSLDDSVLKESNTDSHSTPIIPYLSNYPHFRYSSQLVAKSPKICCIPESVNDELVKTITIHFKKKHYPGVTLSIHEEAPSNQILIR